SVVVRSFAAAGSISLLASIGLLLLFQFFNNLVQLVEARVPKLAVSLDPRRLFFESTRPEAARPHAPDLLRDDELGLLQDTDVLPHARQGHVERFGQIRDR